MNHKRSSLIWIAMLTAVSASLHVSVGVAQSQQPSQAAIAHKIGIVKSIKGNSIVLQRDSGPDVTVIVQDSTRMQSLPPGETDLRNATPMQLKDLQIGDRMLARGPGVDDAQPFVASTVIVMTRADLARKRQQEQEDWLKRGIGGVVSSTDASSEAIVISIAPNNFVTIKASKTTRFLRYAANSVKFVDAKPGEFAQIKTGDQLRARGNRSTDGKELVAEDVVSGAFRNIAGTVLLTDVAHNEVHVMDLLTKKAVTVRITGDSLLRRLPSGLAEGLAQILKQSAPGRLETNHAPPDFQRILVHAPAIKMSALQKGDALMIVGTPDAQQDGVNAITLLSGVEPILAAAPSGSGAATLLSGWNLTAGGETAQ